MCIYCSLTEPLGQFLQANLHTQNYFLVDISSTILRATMIRHEILPNARSMSTAAVKPVLGLARSARSAAAQQNAPNRFQHPISTRYISKEARAKVEARTAASRVLLPMKTSSKPSLLPNSVWTRKRFVSRPEHTILGFLRHGNTCSFMLGYQQQVIRRLFRSGQPRHDRAYDCV